MEQELTSISGGSACNRDDDWAAIVNGDMGDEGTSQDFFKMGGILTALMGRAFDGAGSFGRGVACHKGKGNLPA